MTAPTRTPGRRIRALAPWLWLWLWLWLLVPLAAGASDQADLSGEQIFARSCRACHQTGTMGAPRVGDRKGWQPLIREGQHKLTAQAWVGIRKMPPRGGDDDATLEEFGRSVAFMARNSGAAWPDPTPEQRARIEREVARLQSTRK